MHPARRNVVLLSFEGPDRYASVGGLGTRVTQLAEALSADGSSTTLLFVGDPALAATERVGDNLEYRRWAQWVSRYHPGGVYDGEYEKANEIASSVPRFVVEEIIEPALGRDEGVTVIAEEWQMAGALLGIDALLKVRGLRRDVVLIWNANNTYGFESLDWGALCEAAAITTVSRYMKFELGLRGLEALVIPNGIPDRLVEEGAPPGLLSAVRTRLSGTPLFLKVGRYDPDKRWLQAIDALAHLHRRGIGGRLLMRGGREAYGREVVLPRALVHGLRVAEVSAVGAPALIERLAEADADVIDIRSFLDDPLLRALYAHVDAVLANSGREPFGLVGLEVFAAGGVAVTGSTGEEYAEPFVNALVCDTEDGLELASYLESLLRDPRLGARIRAGGRATAERYRWSELLEVLDSKLAYIATR